jgi:hypothetical protein
MNPFTLPDSSTLAGHRTSVAALIVANVLPLLGVVALGWNAFDVAFIYWTENVVLGVINVLKILFCAPDPDEIDLSIFDKLAKRGTSTPEAQEQVEQARQQLASQLGGSAFSNHAIKLFLIPFFCVHYGIFCLVHGVFICVLLGGNGFMGRGMPADPFDTMIGAIQDPILLLCVGGLAVSHVVSFVVNYLGKGEYRRTVPIILMFQPYGRIVVLHIAILFGGFAAVLLGSPKWLLVPLMIGKTLMDLKFHLWEHKETVEPAAETGAATTALESDLYGEK